MWDFVYVCHNSTYSKYFYIYVNFTKMRMLKMPDEFRGCKFRRSELDPLKPEEIVTGAESEDMGSRKR